MSVFDRADGLYPAKRGARLVEDHEVPDFFDVMVRTTALESGYILTLFELTISAVEMPARPLQACPPSSRKPRLIGI